MGIHLPDGLTHTCIEGKIGVVTKVSPDFVTLKVDGKIMKKAKWNVVHL